ncbi:MAG: hypothetical protein RL235_1038 [Chlamydiota bacterium]|jgi:hypothetical protein
MKKLFFFASLLIVIVAFAGWLAWVNRTTFIAYMISSHLRVPVLIEQLELNTTTAEIDQLWIGNPSGFRTKTAFSAARGVGVSSWSKLRGDPLIIDAITISNIFVGLEYNKSKTSNWDMILQKEKKKVDSKPPRDYLIRKVVLENLTVAVTDPGGKTKEYPTIARLEFNNISSQTGFPIEEIEKAIFNLMMQKILQQFNPQQLIKDWAPLPKGTPLPFLPKSGK